MTETRYTLHIAQPDDQNTVATVAVTGEIDATNAADFTTAIRNIGDNRAIILDLTELLYLDSAGFAALDQTMSHTTALIVLRPESKLRKAATLMGLPYHDDIDTARAVL